MSTKSPRYESPNIVIVPTVSFISNKKPEEPPAKKQKLESSQNVENPSINVLPSTSSYIPQVNENEESKKTDVNSIKKEIKVNSWASNYLNSIGMNTKPIKMNLSISKNKVLEKIGKAAEKGQEDSVKAIRIDSSKDDVHPIEDSIKIITMECSVNEPKPVEDNFHSIENVANVETTLNTNTMATYIKESNPVEPGVVNPSENYHHNIELINLNTFNTMNKRKYDEYLNPVPDYYNTNFSHTNVSVYSHNYYDYTYNIIEKQLYEMEKGSHYLSQSSSSASTSLPLPTNNDIFSKSERDNGLHEPKSNKLFDTDTNFKGKHIISETRRRNRFDSDSSYSDAKIDERENRSTSISSKHRRDSRSPYKKVNQQNTTSKPRYKERSSSPYLAKTKQCDRYSSRSQSYKKRNSPEPRKSKHTTEGHSEDKPKSNYDKEKKIDKEKYYEKQKSSKTKVRRSRTPEREQNKRLRTDSENFDKIDKTKKKSPIKSEKSCKTKVRRSRTPEREQNKRARTDSENFDKIDKTKKKSPIKSVIKPKDNCQEKHTKSQSPGPFDLRSKLSRANKYHEQDFQCNLTDPELKKIRDNLLVTINQQTNNEKKTKAPSKIKVTEKKSKGKKIKTIQFTIKVLCEEGDDSSSVSEDSEKEASGDETGVQGFLDDFNVDEIVDSLKHARRNTHKGKKTPIMIEKSLTNKQAENSGAIIDPLRKEVNIKENNIIKEEPNNKSEDYIILDESKVSIKQEQIDDYNKSNDCVIVETVPTSIEDKQIKKENKYQVTEIVELIKTKSTSSEDNNESNDCVVVDPIETEKIEVKQENINESNDCIIVEPLIENIKIETDSLEKNTSNDIMILDPVHTTEIRTEDTVKKDISKINESNDCIIVELIEPIKVEPNNREIESLAIDRLKVNEFTYVDNTEEIQIKKEAVNKHLEIETTPTTTDVIFNIPLPVTHESTNVTVQQEITHESTNVTVQQEILTPLVTKDIKQEIIDRNEPTTQNDHESNVLKELLEIPLPVEIPSIDHANDQYDIAKSSDITNGKGVTGDQIKKELIENGPFNPPSKNQNHEETMNDTTYDSDASTVKLQHDSDDEETNVLMAIDDILMDKTSEEETKLIEKEDNKVPEKEKSKIIEKEDTKVIAKDEAIQNEETKLIEVTVPIEQNEICKSANSPKIKALDAKPNSSEAETLDSELNVPSEEVIIKNNKSIPKIQIEKNKDESIKQNIMTFESPNSKLKEVPKTEMAKSNQKQAPKTELIKTSPKTKTESPKTKTEQSEKRQVTDAKKDEINLSEFNQTKQKLEDRMFEYLKDKYTITSLIHNGRFSNIYRCHDSKKRNYVVKMIADQANRLSLGADKEQILQTIQRDIPKENIHTVFMIDSFGIDRHWAFLMEYFPTDLKTVLSRCSKPFSIRQVQNLAGQLVTALMVLRNNNIVHSDIKPAHILMNESREKLKLCGFDGSYYQDQVNLLPNIGTLAYRAPEVIVGYSASFSIDVWSTAVVLFEMFTKRKLFNGIYNNQILFNQMCLFGDMPLDMIQRSVFKGNHFKGNYFMKRSGYHGKTIEIIYKFHKTFKFHRLLYAAYDHLWSSRSLTERANDMVKLYGFFKLLEQMLVIDPRRRLSIEFVCTDPFITDIMYT